MSEETKPERIYLSPPDVGARERELLLEAFDSGWIAPVGPMLNRFEAEVARRLDVPAAVAVSSGTAALHLALLLCGVGPGDRVVVADATFVATANAVRYCGAEPVFVDVHPDTWTMDPRLLARALEQHDRVKAVVPVDLYGQCADYDALAEVCEAAGVPIVADAAESLGASYRGRAAGSLTPLGVLSFNGNKILTTSGGGVLVGQDPVRLAKARKWATQSREPVAHYEHEEMGFNYRLSNLLAAVGVAQLEALDDRVAKRRAVRQRYADAFAEVPGVELMPRADYGEPNDWLTCIQVEEAVFGAGRDRILAELNDQRIEGRPLWKPMHMQPLYREAKLVTEEPRQAEGTVSAGLYERGVALPSGSNLTAEQQGRVIAAVLAARG